MATGAFTYSPLKNSTSIRLLRIIGNNEPGPLHGELLEVDLATETPPYTALSYCWGDQTDTREIICNGKLLTITSTLELALKMTKDHCPKEFIWVDQVCICQSNLQEKVQQIQIMASIYQSKTLVDNPIFGGV